MGTRFEISAIAQNDEQAWKAVEAGISEIRRIESIISSWQEGSQTSKINTNAGVSPVKVNLELFHLIQRANKISSLTEGAFDISTASLISNYKFDQKEHALPTSKEAMDATKKINWKNILLNISDNTVFLTEKGMKIGFGAIGKGYAANRAKAIMEKMEGIEGGVVNASGDLIVWGKSKQEEGWKVKITDPSNVSKALGWITLSNMSIVTSGDYEKYFTSSGKRYAHIIDPKTGYPTTGIKSVTVICPDAELADALATSFFVLGVEKALSLANRIDHVECLIVDDDNKLHQSMNMNLNYY